MFEIIYSVFFFLLVIEVLIFLFFNIPTPKGWKGKAVNFISHNKSVRKFMKGYVVVILIALVFFIDSHNTEGMFQVEKEKLKSQGTIASQLRNSFLSYTIIKIQRNKYITFLLIYASLALNAYVYILQYMYDKRANYEKEQQQSKQNKQNIQTKVAP